MAMLMPGLVLFAARAEAAETDRAEDSIEEELRSFVEDFRHDPFAATPVTFGVRVHGEGGGDWHIVVAAKATAKDEVDVTLHKGFPAKGVGYFNMDVATFLKIARGEMSLITGMGKARASDFAPVEFDVSEGFDPGEMFWRHLSPLIFHFWTKGLPEVLPFDKSRSRRVHGGNSVPLYYERGLRTVWFQIEKGQHINKDPKDQTNPFASMFIFTRGKAHARLGGQNMMVEAGQMVFVPEDMSHEFWNDSTEPCEFVLIMFGEGA